MIIRPATTSDREWAAVLMTRSEPWVTLGRTLDASRASVTDAEFHVFAAHEDGEPVVTPDVVLREKILVKAKGQPPSSGPGARRGDMHLWMELKGQPRLLDRTFDRRATHFSIPLGCVSIARRK